MFRCERKGSILFFFEVLPSIVTFLSDQELNKLHLLFPKQKSLDSSKLTESADDNFEFDGNGRVLKKGRKHCGKRRNCSL